jgi:hypothetical protein
MDKRTMIESEKMEYQIWRNKGKGVPMVCQALNRNYLIKSSNQMRKLRLTEIKYFGSGHPAHEQQHCNSN